jgi:hypothetical protein
VIRVLFYSAVVALVFYGGYSMEQERIRVLMELQNDSR